MIDDVAIRGLANEIEKISPRPHHSSLLETVNSLSTDHTFQFALSRGGWYRQGGVIGSDGTRISDDLETWAKAELESCGGDLEDFIERHVESDMRVTRHTGRTHYFVASYSPAPEDFLQLEIEELQEVLDRKLIDPDNTPQDLQDMIEPIAPSTLEAQPVAAPRYCFRRLIDIRQSLAKITFKNGRTAGLPRFIAEWSHSSAAMRGHFSKHWIVAFREHQDRYRNPIISASLISCHARNLKPFHWNIDVSGAEMSMQLQAFDRAAGYLSAWYFHLLAGIFTPPKIADTIISDLDEGYRYLPETEIALLREWTVAPYSV